jgi:hypothetical protein
MIAAEINCRITTRLSSPKPVLIRVRIKSL